MLPNGLEVEFAEEIIQFKKYIINFPNETKNMQGMLKYLSNAFLVCHAQMTNDASGYIYEISAINLDSFGDSTSDDLYNSPEYTPNAEIKSELLNDINDTIVYHAM